MVGQTNKEEEIRRALKTYILREREKQKLEEEAEAEKTRKKLELDQKKLKEETEFKEVKDELAAAIKRQEQLKQNRVKVFEHLKKLISDPNNKPNLLPEDVSKLLTFGIVVTHVNTVPTQPVYLTTVPATVIPRASTVSVNSQYKTSTAAPIPVQSLPAQKRSRSPSPFHPAYNYKQAAGPHAFQKFEDTHRNHDYGRGYSYKPGSSIQSGSYNPFYAAGQSVPYTHPSPSVHSNAPVYSTYSSGREDALHKSQPTVVPPHTAAQHASIYSHRSSLPPGPSSSMQSSNHVSYLVEKTGQSYPEDKYVMVRPTSHGPVHGGPIPIQQSSQGNKQGSISSGFPVRPVATQIVPASQMHIQQSHGGSHGGHHGSQTSHHSAQPPPQHHSSISHHGGPSHHGSSQQQQQQQSQHLPQPHHQQSSVHYPPHSQPQLHHSSSQQPHSSSQPPVSVQSHHSSQQQHHQQHLQQLHVSAHHAAPGSHHQLLAHHPSSIHHTSSQQHLQQAMQHHQQVLQQSHPQQLHHQQMSQPHIQQHISSHQSHMQGQQSQPTSVVTSQYANQINAIQGGSRLVYSQSNIPH